MGKRRKGILVCLAVVFCLIGSLLLPAGSNAAWGQTSFTLSGTVVDQQSGELLIGANVGAPSLALGTVTNEYGYYVLHLPASADSVSVVFTYIGYQSHVEQVLLQADRRLDVQLSAGVALQEVVVEGNALRNRIRSSEMSVEAIDTREVRLLPLLLGESDILKAIQLKPGIPSGAEGTTGLFVRGGGSDQNLFILDEAVVYNANHLFGFFSTFNTDAVKDLRVYKGGFPAQYGGRLSSVIDVKLKEGNNQTFTGSGGLGLIASRLTLEGPIARDKSSFIISGRRTYFDLFTRAVNRSKADDPDFNPLPNYFFYDLNTKVNVKLGERDRLYLSGYFGRDVFAFNNDFLDFNFDWGNATGTLRWNHLFSSRLFANTTLTYSDYRYVIDNKITGFSFRVGSNIRDANLKTDFSLALNARHSLRFGGQLTGHTFSVGRLKAGSDDGAVSFSAGQNFSAQEFGLYLSDEISWTEQLVAEVGLRTSGFSQGGQTYLRLEPRLSSRLSINDRLSVKASYARMHQYLHLIANAGVTLPTDIWYPSSPAVRPQVSDQIALGAFYLLRPNLLLSLETYYKRLGNQLEFVDGAQLFANDDLESEFAVGRGDAYGLEVGLEKKEGRLTGWIGYTLALTRRGDFTPIVSGRRFAQNGYFFPIYDRRHDVSVVAFWRFNRRLTASATFVYGSGDLRWMPTGRFTFQDISGAEFSAVVPLYQDRNNYRLPPYHRLDLGLVYRFFPKWGEHDLTLNVVNVYDRRNTFFIYLQPVFQKTQLGNGQEIEVPYRIAARQVSLFPILPALTWNFKF